LRQPSQTKLKQKQENVKTHPKSDGKFFSILSLEAKSFTTSYLVWKTPSLKFEIKDSTKTSASRNGPTVLELQSRI